MELLKPFFFTIIGPMIWLGLFSYSFAASGVKLAIAWKEKKIKHIWLYLWIILIGIYFLFTGFLYSWTQSKI